MVFRAVVFFRVTGALRAVFLTRELVAAVELAVVSAEAFGVGSLEYEEYSPYGMYCNAWGEMTTDNF